jgi:tetratricopeptide (TPR) repeat protein
MALNAVERRLVDLRHSWESFTADPAPRLLVWTVPDAAMRLVRAFLEAQKHEGEYVTHDLFIVFDAPFENSIQYSRALKEQLAGRHAASADDLEHEGLDPSWPVAMASFPDSAYGFMRAVRSLGGTYHKAIGHLVPVLAPSSVASPRHFAAWLARALEGGQPERLRLLALDSLETPQLDALQPADPGLLQRQTLDIDMTAVATETFAQERTVGPAGVFRNMLMALVSMVEKAPAAQVLIKARDAVAFADSQNWKDQRVVVAMLVAGALLKEKRHDEAVATYRSARATAATALQEGHPAGAAMVLQTWFGEAGAALAAGRVSDAVIAYDNAAVVAQEAKNLVLAVEAFRMSAFCHARLGEREAAVERGVEALKTGQRLRREARGMTTLPLAANDLLRVLDEDSAQAIEAIRTRGTEQTQQLNEALEQRATLLERTADHDPIREAQETFAGSRADLVQQADRELTTVVADAEKAFQQVFAQARRLLGDSWPLGEALLPAAAGEDHATP